MAVPTASPRFEGTGTDEQIRKRDTHTFSLALAVELAGEERDRDRYRLDGNACKQVVQEALPASAAFGGVGACNAVGEFEHGDDGDRDSIVTGLLSHSFQELAGITALAFGGDGRC